MALASAERIVTRITQFKDYTIRMLLWSPVLVGTLFARVNPLPRGESPVCLSLVFLNPPDTMRDDGKTLL